MTLLKTNLSGFSPVRGDNNRNDPWLDCSYDKEPGILGDSCFSLANDKSLCWCLYERLVFYADILRRSCDLCLRIPCVILYSICKKVHHSVRISHALIVVFPGGDTLGGGGP